jgi:hypothetical protein
MIDFIKYTFFMSSPYAPLKHVKFKRFMRKLFHIPNTTLKLPKVSIEVMIAASQELPNITRTFNIVEQRRRGPY